MPDWLRRRAQVSPDKQALVAGERMLTFAALDAAASAAASRLRGAGVSRGDRVALLAGNSLEYAVTAWGVARAGAVLVPLNARLTPREVADLLADCEAALVVLGEGYESPGGMPALPLEDVARDEPHSGRLAEAGDFDLASPYSVIYTSGTSGRPKGATLSYANFYWNAVGSMLNIGLREDDCWLACMPLYHVGGLSILVRGVIYGSTVEVHDSFDPERVARALDGGVTVASVVATMLRRLLELRPGGFGPRLRCILLGGGPVPLAMVEECLQRGIPVAPTYGLTEAASQVATLTPAETWLRPGSAGKALLPLNVRTLRGDGSACAPGEAGEIAVRGPTVMLGYYRRPGATAAALRDGWLHTGDYGYLDGEGYLYVVDRRDDLIVTGGENVYPTEVEDALLAHPAVRDAGVFALPDEAWGQRVAAAVSLHAGARVSAEELQAFCRGRLAAFKAPREVVFIAELPRTPSGKLLRRELALLADSGASE